MHNLSSMCEVIPKGHRTWCSCLVTVVVDISSQRYHVVPRYIPSFLPVNASRCGHQTIAHRWTNQMRRKTIRHVPEYTDSVKEYFSPRENFGERKRDRISFSYLRCEKLILEFCADIVRKLGENRQWRALFSIMFCNLCEFYYVRIFTNKKILFSNLYNLHTIKIIK